MEANPSKFQVILAKSKTRDFSITIDCTCIQAAPVDCCGAVASVRDFYTGDPSSIPI